MYSDFCRIYAPKNEANRFEEENKTEKTFREVIRDIKEGEVWELDQFKIKCYKNGSIVIRSTLSGKVFGFEKKDRFKLQRKEYAFEEAFKVYKEGKEIESVHSGYRYKKENGRDLFFSKISETWKENNEFKTKEIIKMWYIND